MYSVVLMAALTTSVETPDLGRHRRGGGCCGCYGGGYGGCYGGGYGGCYGGSYGGCYGGCYGGGYVGGYGCCGGVVLQTTDGTEGTTDGQGQTAQSPEEQKWYEEMLADPDMPAADKENLRSNWAGANSAERKEYYDSYRAAKKGGTKKKGGDKGSMMPKLAPATIVVNLPADAKLTIDDAPTTSLNNRRTFISPILISSRPYAYTLKAKVTREGKPVVVTKRVTIRAGQETEVTMEFPTAVVHK